MLVYSIYTYIYGNIIGIFHIKISNLAMDISANIVNYLIDMSFLFIYECCTHNDNTYNKQSNKFN